MGLDLFLAAAKHSRRTCLLLGKSSDRLMGREITQRPPRARRDLQRAQAAGRFAVDDLDVALACTAGALLGVLYLASANDAKPASIDRAADELAANLLRMFGVPADEARRLANRKLPRPA